MNEKLKVIVEELGKEPFNKKYNVISFDALGSEQLLQVCTFTGTFDSHLNACMLTALVT